MLLGSSFLKDIDVTAENCTIFLKIQINSCCLLKSVFLLITYEQIIMIFEDFKKHKEILLKS